MGVAMPTEYANSGYGMASKDYPMATMAYPMAPPGYDPNAPPPPTFDPNAPSPSFNPLPGQPSPHPPAYMDEQLAQQQQQKK
jgi:hypothetical protein